MTWYFILFLFSFGLFVVKTCLSWFLGDIDFDVDCDGDIDSDGSSIFSLKGVLHFLLGFSGYLTLYSRISKLDNINFGHYLIAIGIGILFMIMLYYAYKITMKLNHSSEDINLEGKMCTILVNLKNGDYQVMVYTEQGTLTKTVSTMPLNENLKIGDEYVIYKIVGHHGYYIGKSLKELGYNMSKNEPWYDGKVTY